MQKQLKLRSRFAFSICLAGLLYFMLPGLLRAGSIYTSSAAFLAATTPNLTENYSTFTNGQDISSGFNADGFTYSAFVLTNGATTLDITNLYNSFSGLSLGADHTAAFGPSDTFFLGGEGATLTFSQPVDAFGMFFNVNLDSGTYGFCSSVGCASTGSASYDTSTFVFAGLTSSIPFSSITFDSTGASADYNVPELLATTSTVPEPSSSLLFGIGLVVLLASVARSKRRAPSTAN